MRMNMTASDWGIRRMKLIVGKRRRREEEKERRGSGWSRDRRSSLR